MRLKLFRRPFSMLREGSKTERFETSVWQRRTSREGVTQDEMVTEVVFEYFGQFNKLISIILLLRLFLAHLALDNSSSEFLVAGINIGKFCSMMASIHKK